MAWRSATRASGRRAFPAAPTAPMPHQAALPAPGRSPLRARRPASPRRGGACEAVLPPCASLQPWICRAQPPCLVECPLFVTVTLQSRSPQHAKPQSRQPVLATDPAAQRCNPISPLPMPSCNRGRGELKRFAATQRGFADLVNASLLHPDAGSVYLNRLFENDERKAKPYDGRY